MSVEWPAALPLPQFGLRYNVVDPQMRTLMASGRTISRRRFSDVPTEFSARWMLRQSEAEIFEQFYQNDAVDGSEWIEMPLVTAQGEGAHYVRFRGAYSCRRVGADLWEYTANMQMYLRPGSPEWPPGAGGDPGPGPGPTGPYLTFAGESDFTLKTANSQVNWDGILEYSTDKELWVVWDGSEIISSGSVLYLRGKGNTIITGTSTTRRFVISGASSVSCDGDIMSLLDWEDPEGAVMGVGCFFALFYGCVSLIKSPNMTSTTATSSCYERMFESCTSLVVPPELPATTVANRSYGDMFAYCSSLISTPSLPALTIDVNCYIGMFRGCTSLTRPADLPATTLYVNCYSAMFYGCENIRVSQSVGGVPWRIPSVGLMEQAYLSWGADMLTGTGGDFIAAPFSSQPNVNTTYYLY